MSSISVLPGVGTAPAVVAVAVLPDGSAAPMRVPINVAGAPVVPMTDASAQAFAAAVASLSAVLLPRAPNRQHGALLFGLPI